MALDKRQLNAQHKDDKTRFNKIKGILVVSAKHFHVNKHGVFHYSSREFNWKITNKTHNLKFAKLNYVASVIDLKGKQRSPVIVTNIRDVTGSIAKKMASKLEPVVLFYNDSLVNGKMVKGKCWR